MARVFLAFGVGLAAEAVFVWLALFRDVSLWWLWPLLVLVGGAIVVLSRPPRALHGLGRGYPPRVRPLPAPPEPPPNKRAKKGMA